MADSMIPNLPMTSSGLPDATAAANSYRDAVLSTHDTVRIANEIAQTRSLDAPIRALSSDIVGDIKHAKTDIPERVALWIRENVKYTQETPMVEVLQGPYRTLGGKIYVNTPMGPFRFNGTGTGDCDDLSILFATLCRSLGLEAFLVGVAKIDNPDSFFHAMGYYNGVFYELSKDKPYGGVGDSRVASEVPYAGIIGLIYDPVRKDFKRVKPVKKSNEMSQKQHVSYDPMGGLAMAGMSGESPSPSNPNAPYTNVNYTLPVPGKQLPKEYLDRPLNQPAFCGEPIDSLAPRYTVPFNIYAPSRQISGISMNGTNSMGISESIGIGIRPVTGVDPYIDQYAIDPYSGNYEGALLMGAATPVAAGEDPSAVEVTVIPMAYGTVSLKITIPGKPGGLSNYPISSANIGKPITLIPRIPIAGLPKFAGAYSVGFTSAKNGKSFANSFTQDSFRTGGRFYIVCSDLGVQLVAGNAAFTRYVLALKSLGGISSQPSQPAAPPVAMRPPTAPPVAVPITTTIRPAVPITTAIRPTAPPVAVRPATPAVYTPATPGLYTPSVYTPGTTPVNVGPSLPPPGAPPVAVSPDAPTPIDRTEDLTYVTVDAMAFSPGELTVESSRSDLPKGKVVVGKGDMGSLPVIQQNTPGTPVTKTADIASYTGKYVVTFVPAGSAAGFVKTFTQDDFKAGGPFMIACSTMGIKLIHGKAGFEKYLLSIRSTDGPREVKPGYGRDDRMPVRPSRPPYGSQPVPVRPQEPVFCTLRFNAKTECNVVVQVGKSVNKGRVLPNKPFTIHIPCTRPGREQVIISGNCGKQGTFHMANIPASSLNPGEVLDFVLIPNQPPHLARRSRAGEGTQPDIIGKHDIHPPKGYHDYGPPGPPSNKKPKTKYVLAGEIPAPLPLIAFDKDGYLLVDITEPVLFLDRSKNINYPWPKDSNGRIWVYFASSQINKLNHATLGNLKFGSPAAYAAEVEQKLRLLPLDKDKWPGELREAISKDFQHIKKAFAEGTNSPVDPVFANSTLAVLSGLELYAALAEEGFAYKSPQADALVKPAVEVSPGQMAVPVDVPQIAPQIAPTTSNEAQIIAAQPAAEVAAQIQTQSESGAANQAANDLANQASVAVAEQIATQVAAQPTQPGADISPQNVVVEPTQVVVQPITQPIIPPATTVTEPAKEAVAPEEKKGGGGGLLALAAAAAGVYFLTRH